MGDSQSYDLARTIQNKVDFILWCKVLRVFKVLKVFKVLRDKNLLVMVGLAFDDGAGAVELFGENQTHHLMGEGHE